MDNKERRHDQLKRQSEINRLSDLTRQHDAKYLTNPAKYK